MSANTGDMPEQAGTQQEARGRATLDLRPRDAVLGAGIAATIYLCWGAGLVASLVVIPWEQGLWAWAPVMVVIQTFLYTGLFISAHDAMHGIACWRSKRINDVIGRVALLSYALFSFKKLVTAHHAHHAHPAHVGEDPDFHDGERVGFWGWYGTFLWRYLSVWQVVGMAVIFNVLAHGAGIAEPELIVFWVVPSLLSTLQLFYFGTYLPHRDGEPAHRDGHRARSNEFAPWLSFLTCYHFGYHWEHHAAPAAPWWRLPEVWREQRAKIISYAPNVR